MTPPKPRLRAVNFDLNFQYDYEKGRFGEAGVDLVLEKARGEEATIRACAGADIVLIENADQPFSRRIISTLDRCRMIIRYGVGVDNIDVAAATEAGIVVANAADFCTEEVSDHAAALLLGCARRIVSMDRSVRAGRWADFPRTIPIRRMSKLTLGIVGLGRIGGAVARKMAGFQMRTIATDPYVKGGPAGLVPLSLLLAESDLVSIHVPLNAETRGMANEPFLRAMKPTAFLVNTSRGPVVDEKALARALSEKWIAGAAIDVMEVEPLPAASPLPQFDQVILTPHYAASSVDALEQLRRTIADSVVALAGGFWPPFPVNPEVKPRVPLRR